MHKIESLEKANLSWHVNVDARVMQRSQKCNHLVKSARSVLKNARHKPCASRMKINNGRGLLLDASPASPKKTKQPFIPAVDHEVEIE